jgi:hypothetical protein
MDNIEDDKDHSCKFIQQQKAQRTNYDHYDPDEMNQPKILQIRIKEIKWEQSGHGEK